MASKGKDDEKRKMEDNHGLWKGIKSSQAIDRSKEAKLNNVKSMPIF